MIKRIPCETGDNLLPDPQSASRPSFSSDTAILQLLSDNFRAVNDGDVAVLALSALSAAFDMVDHGMLLQHLQSS